MASSIRHAEVSLTYNACVEESGTCIQPAESQSWEGRRNSHYNHIPAPNKVRRYIAPIYHTCDSFLHSDVTQ